MAAGGSSKKSTKDLILEAAFSLCAEPERTSFSMSELAAKVGVSKTAIYRHYENKEAVSEAMEKQFFDTIGQVLIQLQKDCEEKPNELPHIPVAELVKLFATRPEYINYIFSKISKCDGFDVRMGKAMEERGIYILKNQRYDPENPLYSSREHFNAFLQSFYSGTAIFLLIKIRNKFRENGIQVPSVDDFADRLVDFISKGLKGSIKNKEKYVVADISEERFEELNEISRVDESHFPAEDRFLTALASVINTYTYDGVTIERIAEELHLAKSSLYSHFDNKSEMIVAQIARELSFMQMVIMEHVAETKNFSEYLYVVMRSEYEYFMARPSIIPICGWLLLRDPGNPFFVEKECAEIARTLTSEKNEDPVVDMGVTLSWDIFMFWIASIPIALVGHEKKKVVDNRKYFESALKLLFGFINNGIADISEGDK